MNILLVVLVLLVIGFIYAVYQRNKHFKEYVKRKEHDQRFNQGKRKGVEW